MRLNFIVLPIVHLILCRDNLDCPKYHLCVQGFLFNYCTKVKPKFRPAPVYEGVG